MKNKKISKNIIYNSIGTFTYLFCQWLITFIVVWIAGYNTAGIFSLAMSITTTFSIFSTFNMRNYQSSDYKEYYSEKTYLNSRIFTCILSMILMIIYCLFSKLNLFQFLCVLFYMFFKLSEAVVDVLHGSLQRKWRFDIIGLSYFMRGILSIVLFSLTLLFTHNLLVAIIIMSVGIYIFIYFYDLKKYKLEFKNLGKSSILKMFQLILQCIPLVVYGFLLNYYAMYPRVLANELFGTEILGYYSSVATPAIVVQVAASFIFTPLIALFSEYYNEKKYDKLFTTMYKVVILTLIIGVCGIMVSICFRDFIFKILFGIQILKYTYLFNGVIIVSTLTAIIWLLAMILTVSRDYFRLVFSTVVALVVNIVLSRLFLDKFYLNGINYILIISYLIQIVLMLIFILSYRKRQGNNNLNVYYVRSTSIINDSRASKEIISLIENGYDVTVLGWDRDSRIRDYKLIKINDVNVKSKFFRFKAGYGNSKKNILGLLLFQVWEFVILIKNNKMYSCIYACDFDCGFMSFMVSILSNKKMIYDMYDYYTDSRPMGKKMSKVINKLENSVINFADLSIICGEWRKKQIKDANPKKLIVIHNTPNINFINNKKNIKSNSKKLKVVYVGILQSDRLLLEVLEQFKINKNIELHVGGFGIYEKDFLEASKQYDNIFYYGSLKYSDVLQLEKDCDILFATYNPIISNHKYSAPNKVYEAMALKKPIIVCKNTGIDELIKENKTGIIIGYSGKEFIQSVINLSKDKKLLKQLSQNANRAYLEKYNWDKMEQKLINACDLLLKEVK